MERRGSEAAIRVAEDCYSAACTNRAGKGADGLCEECEAMMLMGMHCDQCRAVYPRRHRKTRENEEWVCCRDCNQLFHRCCTQHKAEGTSSPVGVCQRCALNGGISFAHTLLRAAKLIEKRPRQQKTNTLSQKKRSKTNTEPLPDQTNIQKRYHSLPIPDTFAHETTYREDRDAFYKQLCPLLETVGRPLLRAPTLASQDLDLYHLYREVTLRGGCEAVVVQEGSWTKIFRALPNYKASVTDASFRLKQYYYKYLLVYEHCYYWERPLQSFVQPPLRR